MSLSKPLTPRRLCHLLNHILGLFYSAGRSIIGGGGATFIYSCSQTVKTIEFKIQITISKEINCAEHEYINIAPPPPNYRSSGTPDCNDVFDTV